MHLSATFWKLGLYRYAFFPLNTTKKTINSNLDKWKNANRDIPNRFFGNGIHATLEIGSDSKSAI